MAYFNTKHKKSIEERAAACKERRESIEMRIPAEYADNEVRKARVKFLRGQMKLTQMDVAVILGTSHCVYRTTEEGHRRCPMSWLKLMEVEYKAFIFPGMLKQSPKNGVWSAL